jgi:hypothetical protein
MSYYRSLHNKEDSQITSLHKIPQQFPKYDQNKNCLIQQLQDIEVGLDSQLKNEEDTRVKTQINMAKKFSIQGMSQICSIVYVCSFFAVLLYLGISL